VSGRKDPASRPRLPWRRRLTPSRVLAGSFLLLILAGTLGLRLLPGLYTGERLGWLDSLFTATSAVCVTGLIVVDTATELTWLGQAFVLLLIQLGGLGFLSITTVVILALGRRLPLTQRTAVHPGLNVLPELDLRRLMLDVIRFTLVTEAAGALLLFLLWMPRMGAGPALWHGVFHSISAFCNAGFSTFSDSLAGFQGSPLTLLVTMALILIGGLGFLTLEEIALRRRGVLSGRLATLSIHSRLVLAVTATLVLGGAMLFAVFEWRLALGHLDLVDKLANALFMSVTPRTAGFNTVDYAQTTEASSFLTILLMSVGGSPGSTAGGLKTTTAAVIFLLAWSRLRGRAVTSIWRRTIPEETIQRAVGLFVFGFGLVSAAIFLYTLTELGLSGDAAAGRFLAYMFEAASAFNTVGLSMGVTPELSQPGRLLTVILMYIGRIGPLAFAAAIALREPTASARFRYAYGDVVIG
jgi:trk system potassium uptake protein